MVPLRFKARERGYVTLPAGNWLTLLLLLRYNGFCLENPGTHSFPSNTLQNCPLGSDWPNPETCSGSTRNQNSPFRADDVSSLSIQYWSSTLSGYVYLCHFWYELFLQSEGRVWNWWHIQLQNFQRQHALPLPDNHVSRLGCPPQPHVAIKRLM